MKADRLSPHEREALGRFLRMTAQDVGARAAEFEASHAAAAAAEVRGPHELVALGHGEVAERWRELERVLREGDLERVANLGEREGLRWADRLKALSDAFSRPEPYTWIPVEEAALRPPGDAWSMLGGHLHSQNAGERIFEARRLGRTRDPAWGPALARMLRHDPEEGARRAAARALASIGGDEARRALVAAESESGATRDAIARSFGLLGEREGVPKLIAWLDERSSRSEAAEALGRVGDPAAVPALEESLAAARWPFRSTIREALVAIGTAEAVEALRRHPRKNPLARARELRAVARAVARRAARERCEVPPRMDRLTLHQLASAFRAALVTVSIGVLAVVVVGVPEGQMLTVAVVAGSVLGLFTLFERDVRHERLDLARWRAEDGATEDHLAAVLSRGLRLAARRPLRLVLWAAAVVAAEALTGATGILAGAICGASASAALGRALTARTISRWQRGSGTTLLVDATRGPDRLSARRVFALRR